MGVNIDRTGQRFGMLTALRPGPHKPVKNPGPKSRPRTTWVCRCDCGTEKTITTCSLVSGMTKSCGCYSRSRKHGMIESSEYRSWGTMKQRCRNPKSTSYPYYGGRGIKYVPEWESFEVFMADMGPKPSPAHTLDRIDSGGDYGPMNCRWATRKEQMRNRRVTIRVSFVGEGISRRTTLSDLAEALDIPYWSLYERIKTLA